MVRFKIYQLKAEGREFLFRMCPEGRKVNGNLYELVYEGDIEKTEPIGALLENIFGKLNSGDKPNGYFGHSLSVSDIVVFENGDAHYCNPIGFKKLVGFSCNNVSPLLEEWRSDPAQIRALAVYPGDSPREIWLPNTLKAKQSFVGGLIEMETPPFHGDDTAVLICNEEGKLLGLPPNRGIRLEDGLVYDVVAGPFLVVNAPPDSEDFASLSDEQVERYKRVYR